MPKISSITTVSVPTLSDKLIGTSVGGTPNNQTNNFTLQQLKTLFDGGSPPASPNLQSVLNAGNTATQSIYLTGTIEATNLDVSNDSNLKNLYLSERFYDKNNSSGTSGQYLTSTVAGVQWSTLTISIPTLQQVLTAGNVSDKNITTTGNIQGSTITGTNLIANSNLRVVGTLSDSTNSVGANGQVLSSTVTGIDWVDLPSYSAVSPLIYNNVSKQFSIQQATGTQNGYLSSADWITFDGKQNAGNYITALTGEATASGPGSATIILNNLAVINKTLVGFSTLSGVVTSADSIISAFGKIQGQLNNIIAGVVYQGVWNASTNTPTLVSGVGVKGNYYVVDVAGNTNLDGITDWQVGDWAIFNGDDWQKVDNTDSVTSVNGQVGTVVLTTDNISEGTTNLYYTNTRARNAISSLATGLTYTAGTGIFSFTAGYSIPTIANQTDWTTAYNDSIVSAAVTGTTTKTLTLTQQDGGTITANWTDIAPVTSVFGRTGDVIAQSGDYTTTLVTEGTNLYYLDSRARAAISSSATGLSYNSSTGDFSLTAGYSIPTNLEQADWDTAYNNSIVSAAVTGVETKTLTLTQQDGGTITANWTDYDNNLVTSVFGRVGNVVAQSGDYTTTLVTEGTNLYFTDARAREAISSSATGLTYTEATGDFSLTLGYSIPTVANEGNWTTAYNNSIVSAAVTGTGSKTLTLNQQDGGTVTANWTDLEGITSVGVSMPLAFNVSNSPLTSNGTIAITGAGTNLQYVDGTGSLQTFPSLTGFVTLDTNQTITGLKTIIRSGDVLDFKIGNDTLYGLKLVYTQNELVPSGEATWSFVNTFNRDGSGFDVTPLSFFRGVLVTGERLLSASVNSNLLDYYGNNPTGRYPIYAYNTGVQQFASSIIVGQTSGLVNPVTGAIASLPSGVVANFNGRVIGSNAVNSNEFATLSQIPSLTGYVPYTGANQTVNLNTQQLQAGHATFTTSGSTDTLTINHTSGSGRGIIVTKSGNGEGLTIVKSSGSGNAASITGGITLLSTLHLTNALEDTYILSSANWNTAYNNRITSLTTTGTSGAATLLSNVLNIPQYQAQGNYITALTGEATASGPGSASITLSNSAVTGKVLTGLNVTGSAILDTDSILVAFGKLQNQVNQLVGGLKYDGTWNAATNTPTITSGVGTDGDFYIVNVAGTTSIDGINDWQVGDWIVFHTPAWQKVDNSDSVSSVFGRVGNITAAQSDYSAFYPLIADIKNGVLTVQGDGVLGGSGTFSANQATNATISITHDSVSRTNTTSTQSPSFGGTFTAIDSITSSTEGHITAVNTKTVTIPNTTSPNNATITLSAGSGISGGGDFTTDQSFNETITFSHGATSSQPSVNNSGRTFIQDVTLDAFGHVTGLVSATDSDTFTGTVTSVSGTGGYGGLTLSGTVTTSGNITLGGTPSGTWPISISGNAETVDGFSASQSTIGNGIVVRDGNGYIFGNYINMTDDGNPGGGTSISSFITKQGDNYYRSVSPSNAMVSIRNNASGTWGITASNNIAKSSIGTVVGAYYNTSAGNIGGLKVRLPLNVNHGAMVSFTLRVYQDYQSYDVQFSGYLYSTINQWYEARAIGITCSSSANVRMGRDYDGRAYVWIQGGSYTGAAVFDLVNGYSVGGNWESGWEFVRTNDTPNLALDTTVWPNINAGNISYQSVGYAQSASYASSSGQANNASNFYAVCYQSGDMYVTQSTCSGGFGSGNPGITATGGTYSNKAYFNSNDISAYSWDNYYYSSLTPYNVAVNYGNYYSSSYGSATLSAQAVSGFDSGSGGNWYLQPYQFGATNNSGNRIFWAGADLYISGVLYQNSPSDSKFKDNVRPIENALDKVKAISGVEFEWNEFGTEQIRKEGSDVGVIAQELQSVYPIAVREFDREAEDRVYSHLVVDYEKLHPLALQAIKELSAVVDELKLEIQTLKSKINGSNI
jgi:hypothetical protein